MRSSFRRQSYGSIAGLRRKCHVEDRRATQFAKVSRLMGISRSTYYETPVSTPDDTAIVEAIAVICDEFECYGWRRGQSSHILIRCSTRRSTIRRVADFNSSAWGMLPKEAATDYPSP
jgi:hypothetical protein